VVQIDVERCKMVQRKRGLPRRSPKKRFSVTLDLGDYEALVALGEKHKPSLRLQYLVNFSVQRLLNDARDPQLLLTLGDPIARNRHGA
jgi:hypothetical protein